MSLEIRVALILLLVIAFLLGIGFNATHCASTFLQNCMNEGKTQDECATRLFAQTHPNN